VCDAVVGKGVGAPRGFIWATARTNLDPSGLALFSPSTFTPARATSRKKSRPYGLDFCSPSIYSGRGRSLPSSLGRPPTLGATLVFILITTNYRLLGGFVDNFDGGASHFSSFVFVSSPALCGKLSKWTFGV